MLLDKHSLRETFKQKRKLLSAAELLEFNHKLFEQLMSVDLSFVKFCHIFLPIKKFNEPDTFAWIRYFKLKYPGLQFVISRSNPADFSLTHHLFEGADTLIDSAWGIPEPPATAAEINVEQIDFVFVPLLICDSYGNRVGYGKGFYDRFLGTCRAAVPKVGISIFEPVEGRIDTHPFDIPLDACITPTACYEFWDKH